MLRNDKPLSTDLITVNREDVRTILQALAVDLAAEDDGIPNLNYGAVIHAAYTLEKATGSIREDDPMTGSEPWWASVANLLAATKEHQP